MDIYKIAFSLIKRLVDEEKASYIDGIADLAEALTEDKDLVNKAEYRNYLNFVNRLKKEE